MLDNKNSSNPIHFPKRPDLFEFDDEVAHIFDNMAVRSIPKYEEARDLSIAISADHIRKALMMNGNANIVDVGSSTGAYFRDLWNYRNQSPTTKLFNIHAIAIDSSAPMMKILKKRLPHVVPIVADASHLMQYEDYFDIINMAYVAQFMHSRDQGMLYEYAYEALQPDGLLIISQKEAVVGPFASHYEEEYIKFRLDNGYTREEIDAKTAALKNAMWPQPFWDTVKMLDNIGFVDIQEVCRWMQFSTIVMHKPGR